MNDKQLIEFHFRGNDSPLAKGLQTLTDEKIVARIWEHDHTVWKPEPKEIANRLGWLNSIEKMHQESPRMNALSNELRAQGYTQALLLGMGGSSLAPQVFSETFDPPNGLELSVLDSTDPGAVIAHAERLDIEKTLFIVATKSGSTVETLSFFKYFFNQVADTLGKEKAGEHFVAITDPGSNLVNIAKKHDFREVFLNDPNIGGRYSALSFFGLVPAALVGVDISKLLRRAQTMATQCSPETTTEDNPAAKAGAIMGQLAKGGQDKITFVASPAISDFPNWVEQLIAESTGKEGIGILPVVGEPVGDPTVYQDDRLFVHLKVEADDTHQADLHALSAAGHAVMRLQLEDIYDLGGQFFLWEFATALAGYFLGINPFDQPNVESAKIRAREMVAAFKEKGALPPVNYADPTAEVLDSFIADSLSPGGYLALQAYVHPTPEVERAFQSLRVGIRDRFKVATTFGYGPRFLHSTGQLHKGDAGQGCFIQFVSEAPRDADIPAEAGNPESAITFDTLKKAQALGDAIALRQAGREVISFPLGEDPIEAIKPLLVK